jgi:hypothetical protein
MRFWAIITNITVLKRSKKAIALCCHLCKQHESIMIMEKRPVLAAVVNIHLRSKISRISCTSITRYMKSKHSLLYVVHPVYLCVGMSSLIN